MRNGLANSFCGHWRRRCCDGSGWIVLVESPAEVNRNLGTKAAGKGTNGLCRGAGASIASIAHGDHISGPTRTEIDSSVAHR